MKHDQFIGLVQDRAQLASRGDAETATRATLETLGQRIPEHLAANLAAQLPQEIGEHLRRTVTMGGAGTGDRFGLDEFAQLAAERGYTDEPNAIFRARVVLEVIGGATEDILDKVRDALPAELSSLVESGSSGRLNGGG
ncbi:MAG: DUF2267 domain-containing protein [Actinophytocola sp.]|nr:DUF2267 domain-containing protein [Actinophytocola sp.]